MENEWYSMLFHKTINDPIPLIGLPLLTLGFVWLASLTSKYKK